MKQSTAGAPVEGLWALSEGWHWERLGNLGTWCGGGTPSKARAEFWTDGTIPWVSPKDMKRALIDSSEDQITVDAVASSSAKTVRAGSVLCVMRSGILRHTFPVAVNTVDVTLNQDMRALTPRADVEPRYLAYYLRFTGNTVLHTTSKAGTTVNSIEASRLDRHPVPITDMGRQRLIVARIDELFAEVDDGEAALARARDDLATWHKALLKAAVTGELTAEWRAAKPSNKTGADFVALISANRPPVQGKRKDAKRRGAASITPPFTLPTGWTWTTLDRIIDTGPTNGYSPKLSKDGEGTQALKLTATTAGHLRLDPNCVKVLSELIPVGSPLFLKAGDLLFQRGNTREYVGIAAIYNGPPNRFIYPDLMIRVTLRNEALTEWVWRWAVSPHGRHYLMNAAQGGAGTMPKISGQTLRSMPVPMPPLAELAVILAEVARLTAEADAGHADQMALKSAPATLRQSILAAAFRGDLA